MPPPDEESRWDRARFILPLALGAMLNPLNSTMLATAMTKICLSFGRKPGEGGVLIMSLYITATIGQPLMGRLADIYSPRKVNFLGLYMVILAALTGAFAPAFGWLIVSRVLLGLGTSAAYPSAIAIIQRKYAAWGQTVPGESLGIIAVSGLVSGVLGPVLGGFLTDWFGWQGIFLVNIPWVIVTMALLRTTPVIEPAKTPSSPSPLLTRIDAIGVLFSGLFLMGLVLTLNGYRFLADASLNRLVALLVLPTLLSLLIAWERKREDPFINVRLFFQKPFMSLVYLQTLATNYITYLMLYAIPPWIEGVRNITASGTGLLLLPMTFFSAASAYIASRRKNLTRLSVLAAVSSVGACVGAFFLNAQMPMFGVIGITLLVGLLMGIAPVTNQVLLSVEAPPNMTGVSFGLSRTFGYIGAILSGAQIRTAFREGVDDGSLHQLVWLATGACVLLCVLYALPFVRRNRLGGSVA